MQGGNLALVLDENSSRFAERLALISDEGSYTYAELAQEVNRVAGLLTHLGVVAGDRVALSCPNSPQFTIGYFGILKAGAVVVPLNVLLKADEVTHQLNDSGARVYLCSEGMTDLAVGHEGVAGFRQSTCERFLLLTSALASTDPRLHGCETLGSAGIEHQDDSYTTANVRDDDLAAILYTSGTTGKPKGAELLHRNLVSNAASAELIFGSDYSRPDTYLAALPLFHSFGQTVVQNAGLTFGSTLILVPRFDPIAALELIERHEVTFLAGVPTMYWSLVAAVEKRPELARLARTLRLAVSGGAALPDDVHSDMRRHFGITVLEGYGLSETAPVAAFSRLGEPPRVGSIGTPIPGVQMALMRPGTWEPLRHDEAVGEIAVKGPNVMRGYHANSADTHSVLRDGWLRTGDLGRRDLDGWYYVVDRASDVIIRGGYNIYPREVEAALAKHPDIAAAAVVGVPDERYGEEIRAYVVPAAGALSSAADVVAWARAAMAGYKYPRHVEFVDHLPTTATGKVAKRLLDTTGSNVRDVDPTLREVGASLV